MSKLIVAILLLAFFQKQELRRFYTPIELQEQRIRQIYRENGVHKIRAMYYNSATDAESGNNGRLYSMQTLDQQGRPVDQRVLTPDKKIMVITMDYDSSGHLISSTQKTGGKVDFESHLFYDQYGELQLRINTFTSGTIDSVTRKGVYWNGGVKFILESSRGKVAKTIEEYDSLKQEYRETFVSRDGKIIQAGRSTVDAAGNIVKKEFRSNIQNRFDIYRFEYNDVNLVTLEEISTPQGKVISTSKFEYDSNGLLTEETIKGGEGEVIRVIQYDYRFFADPGV